MHAVTGITDIVKNIGVISTLNMIKVTTTPKGVTAEAMDGQFSIGAAYAAGIGGCASSIAMASVFCRGELQGSFDEFEGTVGLGRLSVFKGFREFHKDSLVTIVKEARGSLSVPAEIKFDNGAGTVSWYRLTSSAVATEFVQVPLFRRTVVDVTASPDEKSIRLFNHWTKEAKKTNGLHFWPGMNARGKLYFSFDVRRPSNSTPRFEFAGGLPFVPLAPYRYPAKLVAEILSLAVDAESLTMSFSNAGHLRIDVTSSFGRYEFVIPGSDYLIWLWDVTDDWPQVYHIAQMVRDDRSMQHDWEPDLN